MGGSERPPSPPGRSGRPGAAVAPLDNAICSRALSQCREDRPPDRLSPGLRGKGDRERRASAHRARDVDGTPVTLDDTEADRQPEPGAARRRLRREEGIEDLLE